MSAISVLSGPDLTGLPVLACSYHIPVMNHTAKCVLVDSKLFDLLRCGDRLCCFSVAFCLIPLRANRCYKRGNVQTDSPIYRTAKCESPRDRYSVGSCSRLGPFS